jgi:hypothetical protein
VLWRGRTLFGTTLTGGTFGNGGTIFRINTDGNGFAVLKSFTGGNDGSGPSASLVLSGTTLYGTTSAGGVGHGVVFSLSGVLLPPAIVNPPLSQTAELGSTVDFGLHTDGSSPLSCQWFFSGTNVLTGCTNFCLELTNVQFSQSGAYTVVITNAAGAVTSAPVMLNVIAAVERRPVPAINLMGDVGSFLRLDYADALGPPANWLPLDTVSLSSTPQFYFDVSAPLPPQRFYRVWQTGTPAVVPSLDLHMVPAIMLTGNVGDSLRLDYINAIGPTDAWVVLATVILTNTSQLYFDVSALGQPPRLYRIIPNP